MLIWLPALILSAQPSAPMERRYAEPVYKIDFGSDSDVNYDGWPDEWTRLRGQGFPPYIRIGIADDPSHASQQGRCLRIDLDGSGGTAFSPPIEISPLFSYLFQGKLKTEGLSHDVAYFTVTFFDAERNQKETFTSQKFSDALAWQEVQIGPLTPAHSDARFAVIGLHLVPTQRSDLTGAAMFDDLVFSRLPLMTIESPRLFNLFSQPGDVEFKCTVSGTRQPNSTILFELLDVSGQIIASERLQLTSMDDLIAEAMAEGVRQFLPIPAGAENARHAGSVSWSPPVPDFGFYQVRASLCGDAQVALQHCVSLAVVADLDLRHHGEFGWSLPSGNHPLSEDRLMPLLGLANVSWLKYPIWYSADDEAERGDRIAAFADQLSAQGIAMVGVFDHPPEQIREKFSNKEHLTVAEVFMQPDLWAPVLDPLLIRLSLKIQWWQLGADTDESFIDYAGLEKRIREIRLHMRRFGQRTRLGLPWNWLHETPAGGEELSWDFLAMSESSPLTSDELTRYAARPRVPGVSQWITLWPLDRHKYDVEIRARDLVQRMVAARIQEVQAVFLGNPFDETRGVLSADGTPGELFLPWCVTSRIVSGADYLGSLQLPNGSHNHVFARDDQAMMVVWNESPTTETLYLGENVIQIDPWGRRLDVTRPVPGGVEQVLQVGTLPVFVTGMNLAVTRWMLEFSFEPHELLSVFTHPQELRYRFRDTFQQGVGGTVRIHVPDVWDISSSQLRFKLATDEELDRDLEVSLQSNASSGTQKIRVDFDVIADREYHFSIYRQIRVGFPDVAVELDTWLDDNGRLVLEQHLINRTETRMNFNCYLFAPGRRRMRMQVFEIGPGRVTHTFKLLDGEELLGKTLWLRVEELGGNRLMNYQVVAQP